MAEDGVKVAHSPNHTSTSKEELTPRPVPVSEEIKPSVFPRFSGLPCELRISIWTFAHLEPLVHCINYGLDRSGRIERRVFAAYHLNLALTCRESLLVGQKVRPPTDYFGSELDTIYFRWIPSCGLSCLYDDKDESDNSSDEMSYDSSDSNSEIGRNSDSAKVNNHDDGDELAAQVKWLNLAQECDNGSSVSTNDDNNSDKVKLAAPFSLLSPVQGCDIFSARIKTIAIPLVTLGWLDEDSFLARFPYMTELLLEVWDPNQSPGIRSSYSPNTGWRVSLEAQEQSCPSAIWGRIEKWHLTVPGRIGRSVKISQVRAQLTPIQIRK